MRKNFKQRLLGGLAVSILLASAPVAADKKTEIKLPLKDTKEQISFKLDEATWLSLDITPDGQTIVFEILGDIYRMPIAGGKAEPILTGLDFASEPAISPDGKQIAFIDDRDGNNNLWVMDFSGENLKKISKGKHIRYVSPEWTPDGDYIVVHEAGKETQFKMYHVNGGSGITLKSGEGSKPFNGAGPSFTPDGKSFYFSDPLNGPRGAMPRVQVSRYDMETGKKTRITQGHGGGMRPKVSPDGNQLVYGTRHEAKTGLRIRDLTTGAERWLVWPIERDTQEDRAVKPRDYLPGYSFTPDGQHVLLSIDGKITKVAVADGSRTAVPFDAEVTLDVGPDLTAPYRITEDAVEATIIHDPQRSPDGQKLVMSILTKIYTVDDTDASEPKRLTKGDAWEFKPVWSPDGNWIAYVTWSLNDGGHIWRMRSNGRGKPKRLTKQAAFYTELAYSPDGSRLVALRGNEWQRHQTYSEFGGLDIPVELVWLPAKGGDVTVIPSKNVGRNPHFGPEGDRVYTYSGEGLKSRRFDGSDEKTHLKVTRPKGNRLRGEAPAADDVRISPNGKYALARAANQLYVMPVPLAVGSVMSVSVTGGGVPVARLTHIGVDSFDWSPDGSAVEWATGSTFFSRPLDSVEFGDKKEENGDEKEKADASEKPEATPNEVATDDAEGDANSEPKEDKKADEEDKKKFEPLDEHEAVSARKISLKVARDTPEGSVVLRGATVIPMADGSDKSNTIVNADIVITNNRIVAVGATGSVSVPQGADIIDVTGKYIVPGFVNTHAHWEFRTQDVLEPQNWSLTASLAYGVTAGLDVQTSHKDYLTYRDMVETGQSMGPRAFMTAQGVFGNTDFKSYDEVYSYLRRYKEHYKTNNIKSYVVGNREQRQWVVQASKALGLMPTTEGAGDMRMDITHAIDGMHGNEHTLPDAPLYDDVIQLFAKTQTAYTATLVVQYNGISATNYFFSKMNPHGDKKLNHFYPRNRIAELTNRKRIWARDEQYTIGLMAEQVAKLQRAGGLVGIGSHGELQGLGYHWEMWAHAMGGMTPVEILQAATIDGAKIIGVQQDLGSLEVGKLADMVILDKNPFDDIKNTNSVDQVMKNGRLYEGNSLDQVWPIKKAFPSNWWWWNTNSLPNNGK